MSPKHMKEQWAIRVLSLIWHPPDDLSLRGFVALFAQLISGLNAKLEEGKTANCNSLSGQNYQFPSENRLPTLALTMLKSLFVQ